jgi:cytoskeleton protein RodZ
MSEDPQKLPVPDAPLTASATAESDPVETQLPPAETAELHAPEAGAQEPVPLETVPVLSAGALIRQAREEAGLHIASLAMALKVPVKRLEALEADRFDLLPSAVFSRALASSVCRALKLNPTQVLAQLPGLSAPRLGYPEESRLSPYSSGSSGQSSTFLGSLSRPALAGGALFLAGAALLVFLPPLPFQFLQSGPGDSAVVTTTVVPLEPLAQTANDTSSPAAAPGNVLTAVTPDARPAPLASASALPAKPAGPTATGTVSAAPIVQGPETAKGPSTGIVVFAPTESSWVEVTDARGVVLLRRMLTPGEVAGATGILPLSAVVGRADVTAVKVRGQAFDLTPIARDNVARFEVK